MRKPALYSSASPARPPPGDGAATHAAEARPTPSQPTDPAAAQAASQQTTGPFLAQASPSLPEAPVSVWRASSPRHLHLLWSVVALLAVLLAVSLFFPLRSLPPPITQKDINAAVLKTLESGRLPSPATKAHAAIRPSVVRVVGDTKGAKEKDSARTAERSVGTGVVIMDKGVILTNLHVVQGADSIKVTFADGTESGATITGVQPENDLAVLQAHKIPDDLQAATLRSTAGLAPGDQVVAVGYPFGIGPSTSAGVISGLGRTFRAPEDEQHMTNLIQFDAAANPGNSGGPLVTMEGEVIGIVTAIYNPNEQRTFVGIGFAVPIENAASAAGMSPF